jgi:hypothetical protein
MAKQIVKSSAMLVLLIGLAFVATAIPAHGQSSTRVAADVPFNFIVRDTQMTAGKYIVSELSGNGDALKISSRDSKNARMTLTNSIQRKRGEATPKLVFHRYGDRYFLAEVWGPDSDGRQLPKSAQERAIERELASINAKSDLAMNSYERVEVLCSPR